MITLEKIAKAKSDAEKKKAEPKKLTDVQLVQKNLGKIFLLQKGIIGFKVKKGKGIMSRWLRIEAKTDASSVLRTNHPEHNKAEAYLMNKDIEYTAVRILLKSGIKTPVFTDEL